MSESQLDFIMDYLPSILEKLPIPDEKFLFFFKPVKVNEEKFLFGLSLKTGVQIFSIITIIQAINSFLDIFSPYSFWLFLISMIAFIFQFVISLYAFISTLKEKASYAKTAYLFISVLFLLQAVYYISKSVLQVIEFITPWDKDFLRLDFLIYIFGYGIFLFIYLYFIYILYLYMLKLKSSILQQENEELYSLYDNNEKND